jgi:aldehyde dehydrogenase (NAD+)
MNELLEIQNLQQQQKQYFSSQVTKPLEFRITQLKKLKELILKYEPRLIAAMLADIGKPEMESTTAEIWFVIEEIDYALRHIRAWARPHRKRTPLLHFWSSSHVFREPYGEVLIIAPWNYPFLLSISPLVGALTAGNVVVLKPSELAPQTALVMEEMLNEHFEPGLVCVLNGAIETAQALVSQPFDYIFFTGGTLAGRQVMQAAARNLTPVTLELGGKSPAIIDQSADLDIAANRVVWGKFMNAGQTCIAPDYLLVHKSVQAELIQKMKQKIQDYYGNDPQNNPDYAHIINLQHFKRLHKLIDPKKVVYGGGTNDLTLYIAPTLMDRVSINDACMIDEIFGPILPVMTFETLDEAIDIIHQRPNPLALYLFTRKPAVEKRIIAEVPFGGGCINDTISHILNSEIPFGGRGASGMGAYHGKHSFDTFSHSKSIIRRANHPDLPLRYPPYKIESKVMRFIFNLASYLF